MQPLARTTRLTASCLLLVVSAAGVALGAPPDRAPLPDDVVKRLVHGPLRKHRRPPTAALERHLDDTLALLERMQVETRDHRGPGSRPAPATTSQMLLGPALHELALVRDDLRREVARVLRGPRPDLLVRFEERFDRVQRLLETVQQAKTKAARSRALTAAARELRAHRTARAAREVDRTPGPLQTWRQERATDQPSWEPAPAPGYMTWQPRPKVYAFLGDPVFLSAAPVPGQEGTCEYTDDDLGRGAVQRAETALTDEIRQLAHRLGDSPARIYEYVSNEIAFEPYYGSLKGAMGTLYSRAGNATDHASLLIALLRASGIPARYVKGVIRFDDDPRVLRWIGAKDHVGARWILRKGAIPAAAFGNDPATPALEDDPAVKTVQFTHVWVEACVPYKNYRGTGADASGHRWIPLDPSFKDRTYQPGIPETAGTVTFDYRTFLSSRSEVLPEERYAELVETDVRQRDPRLTLADVPYRGATIPRMTDILPASLPYEVVAFAAWTTGANRTAEVAEVPAAHRYMLEIIPEDGATPEHDLSRAAAGWFISMPPERCGIDQYFIDFIYCVPAVLVPVSEIVLTRVTLSFEGATDDDRAALAAWKRSPDEPPLPCTKTVGGVTSPLLVVPSIKVDGVERPLTSPMGPLPARVGLCTTGHRLTVRIALADGAATSLNGRVMASTGTPALNTVVFRNLQAADYHAILSYAFQTSDRLLAERAARLLEAVRNTPDANANEDETVGQFLHLVGLKYLRHLSDGIRRIGELDGGSGQSGLHLGLTSARTKVTYLFDEPFAIYRSGFLVDVPGGVVRNVDLRTGEPRWSTFRLATYNGSALESFVWQENARLDAVSTVRGMQFAAEQGFEHVTITRENKSADLAKLTADQPDPALKYTAAEVARLEQEVDAGFTVTAPVRRLTYGNWNGIVWMQERNGPTTSMEIGAFISGGYAGGFAILDPVTPDITFDLPLPPPPIDDILSVFRFGNGREQGADAALVVTAGDPVNMVTGNLYHVERDIAIKGRGLPLVFERSYNSRAPEDGPLGYGWTHTFNQFLVFNDDDANGIAGEPADSDGITSSVTWVDGTGTRKIVPVTGTAGGVPIGPAFNAPAGLFFRVVRTADGAYMIREKSGLTYTFESVAGIVQAPEPQRARLVSIADRNENRLTLAYGASGRLEQVSDSVATCPGPTCRSLTFTYGADGRVWRVADWTGRTHEYGYDAAGNLAVYKNPPARRNEQPPVTYTYYPDAPFTHAMERYTLPRGNGMTFEYYANGKVFRHYTTLGETTTFTYNEFRRETTVVNERGHTRRFFFDRSGNLTKLIEENGAERRYAYDAPPRHTNRLSARDPMGRETRYCYDGRGNVTLVILPPAPAAATCEAPGDGRNTIAYRDFNDFGQPAGVKDARNHWTLHRYDARGNLVDTIALAEGRSALADPDNPTEAEVVSWTINTYDTFGSLASTRRVSNIAAKTGPTVEYDYDDRNNGVVGLNLVGIRRLNADGTVHATATLEYDSLGRTTKGVRPDWYETRAEYDDVERMTVGTDDFGRLREHRYDANGNLASSALLAGDVADTITFTYDLSDRRTTTTGAAGFITNFEHDAAGNLAAVTNPDGFTLRFEYDPNHRVIRAVDQEGNAVSRTLDLDGRPRSVTDPNGNTTRHTYYGPEQEGRLKSTVDARQPVGRRTELSYDENGNVTRVTEAPTDEEPEGRTTVTSYDELNRPVRVMGPRYADPERGGVIRPLTTYRYDLLGRLVEIQAGHVSPEGADVLARQMAYAWDDFGGKRAESDGADRTWRFTADAHGNVSSITDPRQQTTTFTYDYGGRLKTREDHARRLTLYTRNDLGQVRVAQGPDVTYTYAYDAAHRLASVLDSRGNKQLTYAWSPGGLLNAMEDGDGGRTDYLYDPAGRLTGIWAPNGDLVTFVRDAAGRLTEKWLPNGPVSRYTWNTDNTLASLVNQAGASVVSQHVYAYDDAGNRVTHEETAGGTTSIYAYAYDPLSRLVEVTNTAMTPPAIERYAYDPLGNRTRKTSGADTLTYSYDLRTNQLTDVRGGAALAAAFLYDDNGNLVLKCEGGAVTVSAGTCSGTTVTELTYDALNRMARAARSDLPAPQTYVYDDQGRRIQKTFGASVTHYLYDGLDIVAEYGAAWGAPAALHTHGPGVDMPLLRQAGAQAHYYHQDGLGSVLAVTTASGAVAASARYDAWGNTVASTGVLPVYGYSGREPDETGLIYYRARYYDPAVGRFTQPDPIGFAGGDINLYAYVKGNPVNETDPTGLRNILVPGINISGTREDRWWRPGSRFDRAFRRFTGETSSEALDWDGVNTAAAGTKAARDLAAMVNSIPLGEKVYIFAHSRGGNVAAEASPLFNRRVEFVVTAGTSVRPDYTFDMSQIGQGVAISTPNDWVQGWGGNSVTLPLLGEVGRAGWDRTEAGFTNVPVPELGSHSAYYRDFTVTIGAIDRAIRGSSTTPATPPGLGTYTSGGTPVGLVPSALK